MALSDAELVIGAAQSAPGLVQQYKQATADEQPVSDFQRSLVQKWNDYYSKTGDMEGAKRGFINEAHQNAGGGLSAPAPQPQPSAPAPAPGLANPAALPQTMSTPGPTGAPPIPTSIPVREPAPEPDPNAVRKPLIHRDPTPDAVAAFDNASRPLKERNPALFQQLNTPPPQAAPQPPEMKTQRDFNAFLQVAPQIGAMRNADVAAQSRIDVAQVRGQVQQALEGYRQQGRVQLQQMRADIAQQIEMLRQNGQDDRQAVMLQAQLDMLQARLDAAATNQEALINSREAMASTANDVRTLGIMAQYLGSMMGSQSRLLAPTGGFVGGQGTAVNRQLTQDIDQLRPQVQQGVQNVGQRHGVIPQQPGQAAPPPQPQVGPLGQSTTTQTQSTTRPRVLVRGSTASREPQPAPAQAAQAASDAGAAAAQNAQLPQVPQQRPRQQTQQKPQQKQQAMPSWAVGKSPSGRPYAKKQVNRALGKTRYVDNTGGVIEVVDGIR